MSQHVIFDVLCRLCERMLDEKHVAVPNHQWNFNHYSFIDLQQSARQGCHLCNLILDQLDLERWSEFFTTPEIALQSERGPLTLSIYRKEYHDPFKRRSEEDTLALLPAEVVEITVHAPDIGMAQKVAPCIAILNTQFRKNAGEMV
jgi:hypothetical protein